MLNRRVSLPTHHVDWGWATTTRKTHWVPLLQAKNNNLMLHCAEAHQMQTVKGKKDNFTFALFETYEPTNRKSNHTTTQSTTHLWQFCSLFWENPPSSKIYFIQLLPITSHTHTFQPLIHCVSQTAVQTQCAEKKQPSVHLSLPQIASTILHVHRAATRLAEAGTINSVLTQRGGCFYHLPAPQPHILYSTSHKHNILWQLQPCMAVLWFILF